MTRRPASSASFLVILLAATAAAAGDKPRPELRMLDARVNGRLALAGALSVRPAAAAAAPVEAARLARDMASARADLRTAIPGAEVRMSPATGGASVVANRRGALTAAISGASDEQIVRAFLSSHGRVYGLSDRDLEDLVVLGDSSGGSRGLRMLRLEQRVDGRPVFQSETRFLLDRDGRLVRSVGLMVPNARRLAAAAAGGDLMGADEAVTRLLASAGLTAPASAFAADRQEDGWTRLSETADAVHGEVSAREVYFPLAPGLLVPAWALVVSTTAADWYAVVDAESGDLLWRKDVRDHVSAHDARFRVYVQADGETPADSPAPQSPSGAAPGGETQFAEIAPSIVSMHTAMDASASPNGWIDDCPGGICTANETQTLGNNVLACLDRAVTGPGDNVCDTAGANSLDGNGRPTGNPDSTTRNRDFLGTAPRDFQTTFLPPPQSGNPESGQDPVQAAFGRGSVTQQFYAANWYHDKLYALGFDEAAGNFQVTNFSAMGLGGDRVLIDVQDGSGANNANFSTPPDGVSGRAQMFRFTGPTIDRDGGLDAEILLHELTHGTSNRLVGNGAGLNWDPARGLGEGWSDFYALALLNNTNADDLDGQYAAGAYATYKLIGFIPDFLDNYVYGIRRFPYSTDNTVNPLTWADADDVTNSLTGGIAPSPVPFNDGGGMEVHNSGEIWALTLWEVRSRIIADPTGANGDVPTGNETMLQLVTDGLKATPVDPSFTDARDAILDADCATNACANEDSIWGGFADRGLGYGSATPFNVLFGFAASHLAVKESFDVPHLDVVDAGADVAIDDSAANNNGAIDPGEPILLTVTLTNPWRAASKGVPGVTATLASATPGVTIVDSSSSYGAIAAEGAAAGEPFSIAVGPGVACGSAIDFTLTTSSSLGVTATSFRLRVGAANGADPVVTYTFDTTPNLVIPDGRPRAAFTTGVVADDFEIADLDFRADSVTHTFVGDLAFMLRSPAGVGVDSISLIGGLVDAGSGNNLVNMVVDDDLASVAANDMVQQPATSAPFTGDWLPVFNAPWPLLAGFPPPDAVGTFSRYDGTSTLGAWSVAAADQFELDTGTLNSWSLLVTPVHFDCIAPLVMTPVVLSIDGNGVLDPNEAAAIRPSWQNNTGAPVAALTGAAANFNGPAGPAYSVSDASAAYGTVGIGNTASCTDTADCYAVQIVAGSRPLQHWDSTLQETLPTGEVKSWALHVGGSFTDAAIGGSFYLPVETVFHRGVTQGCGGGHYCPTDAVTRQELALLLIRALNVSPPACVSGSESYPDVLFDDPFCAAIEEAETRLIFDTCDGTNFCPSLPVTREQMAMFVIRSLEAPGFPTPAACTFGNEPYVDVAFDSLYCPWIKELKTRGFAGTCDGVDHYCPNGSETRDALAAVLTRANGLLLYAP